MIFHSRLLAVSAAAFLFACSQVPVSGRNQLSVIPSSQLQQLSETQYASMMQQLQPSGNAQWAATVQTVGQRIASAVEDYLRQTGDLDRVEGFTWAFSLVEGEEANAFAMPGGKVVVYEGIMSMIDGDADELATVMAHEVAHVIAEHGNERMSQQLLTQLGGVGLGALISERPEQAQNLFMTAYGMGTQVGVLLPFSRAQESEADQLGLIFMAKAGYNPEQALEFWGKMQAQAGGASPPELLSTHPAPGTRISKIEEQLPEAMELYHQRSAGR